ncbi:hypothetical protein BH10PSE11_BH10PSE11_26990 [soil metagenome]
MVMRADSGRRTGPTGSTEANSKHNRRTFRPGARISKSEIAGLKLQSRGLDYFLPPLLC